MTKYFVMLGTESGFPIPMIESRDDFSMFDKPSLFDTEQSANDEAEKNILAQLNGYEVYPWEAP